MIAVDLVGSDDDSVVFSQPKLNPQHCLGMASRQ